MYVCSFMCVMSVKYVRRVCSVCMYLRTLCILSRLCVYVCVWCVLVYVCMYVRFV